jgi:GTP-binding protein
MEINTASFVVSNTDISKLPEGDRPEYAFIGRSNVGKSSLINMLCDRTKLAKISSTPGKTQLINHFLINEEWYLVDLPGYGYAKISKKDRNKWHSFTFQYIKRRANLMGVFVLIDSRIPPQKIDLEFMEWLATNQIAFVMVFTKIDKRASKDMNKQIKTYEKEMLKTWEQMPKNFSTSAVSKFGKEPLLEFISETNEVF